MYFIGTPIRLSVYLIYKFTDNLPLGWLIIRMCVPSHMESQCLTDSLKKRLFCIIHLPLYSFMSIRCILYCCMLLQLFFLYLLLLLLLILLYALVHCDCCNIIVLC